MIIGHFFMPFDEVDFAKATRLFHENGKFTYKYPFGSD